MPPRKRINSRLRKQDIGLTKHERERLAGPPRDVSRVDSGASALAFCVVLLICALIVGASVITRSNIGTNAKAASSPRGLRKAIIGGGGFSDGSAGNLIVPANPRLTDSSRKPSDAGSKDDSPIRVPPDQ